LLEHAAPAIPYNSRLEQYREGTCRRRTPRPVWNRVAARGQPLDAARL